MNELTTKGTRPIGKWRQDRSGGCRTEKSGKEIIPAKA